jgi:hypothetical protein
MASSSAARTSIRAKSGGRIRTGAKLPAECGPMRCSSAAARLSRTQLGREHLAVSAPNLSRQPGVRRLHRHPRRPPGRLAKTSRRDRPHHLDRSAQLGHHRSISLKAGIKLLLKDLLASGNRVPTPSKIIVNVSSISCGGRGFVWRTATVLMHVNDRSYQSNRGQAMPLRPIPGRKGATDVEWGAGHRNGPRSSGR